MRLRWRGIAQHRSQRPRFGFFYLRALAPYARVFRAVRALPLVGVLAEKVSKRLLPPSSHIQVTVRNGPAKGLKISVHPRIGYLHMTGDYSPPLQQALITLLSEGATFFDIGAHFGFAALLGARLVGPNGRVIAFEPDDSLASMLVEGARANDFEHLTVVPEAVWSRSGSVAFAPSDPLFPNVGIGKVVPDSSSLGTVSVTSTSLDDACGRFGNPDVIKCDVEGAEVEIFKASDVLRLQRPSIFCEFHSDSNRQYLIALFSRHRYRVAVIDDPDPSVLGHLLAVPAR